MFETDFGKLGVAICFDVNFPEVWQRLADGGAESVIWTSAYSAGASLQAHALNHHYYILSTTGSNDCQLYDLTGQRLLDCHRAAPNAVHVCLDLDRGIYHQNFNGDPRERLLRERGDEVMMENWLEREQWFILKARRPGDCARALARQCTWKSCAMISSAAAARSTACAGGSLRAGNGRYDRKHFLLLNLTQIADNPEPDEFEKEKENEKENDL